MKCIKEEVNLE